MKREPVRKSSWWGHQSKLVSTNRVRNVEWERLCIDETFVAGQNALATNASRATNQGPPPWRRFSRSATPTPALMLEADTWHRELVVQEIKEGLRLIWPLTPWTSFSTISCVSKKKSKKSRMRAGRNALCPCGSGRKYKHCCLPPRRLRAGYAADERAVAWEMLEVFLEQSRFTQEDEEAFVHWWGTESLTRMDLEREIVANSEDAFDAWFAFDRRMQDGRRPADVLLGEEPGAPPGVRAWLEQGLHSSMRLYEVAGVVPGASLTLRDVSSGRRVRVRERTGSQTMRRWEILAARVFEIGASGEPEIDGGFFPLSRMDGTQLIDEFRAFEKEIGSGSREGAQDALLPPWLHQRWIESLLHLQPSLPATSDGDALVFCKVFFDVLDRAALVGGLDAVESFERAADGDVWHWLSEPDEGGTCSGFGSLRVWGASLIIETMSTARAAAVRSLVEEAAGQSVRFRLVEQQDPRQALVAYAKQGITPEGPPDAVGEEVVLSYMERYARRWMDVGIPALDGRSPRQAASDPDDREKLASLLKDFMYRYEQDLTDNRPAYDSTWMWEALGLEDHPDAPVRHEHPPLLGHEVAALHIPGLMEIAAEIAQRARSRPGFEDSAVVTREDLEADPEFTRFTVDAGKRYFEETGNRRAAAREAGIVASHVEYAVNFELHRRKVFWVDDSLAWMLGHTELDVRGEQLQLPFSCLGIAFHDRHTLGLCERLMAADPDASLRGRMLTSLTAFVTRIPSEPHPGLRVALVAVASEESWPWLLVRDLVIDPGARLDDILASRFDDLPVVDRDPIFDSERLKNLVALVLSCILYATSAGVEADLREAPRRPRESGVGEVEPRTSSESVYYLPGKIDIGKLRAMQRNQREQGRWQITHRFMVRGHWRRAAAGWKDQRPRWIEPYWKGPDAGAIIEREYRLRES